jgi:hypothetical protein
VELANSPMALLLLLLLLIDCCCCCCSWLTFFFWLLLDYTNVSSAENNWQNHIYILVHCVIILLCRETERLSKFERSWILKNMVKIR